MTARVLLAYASKQGSTREIAEMIAERLREHGLEADVADARSVTDVTGYHAVVLGSCLYMGRWQRDARGFAQRFARSLVDTPVWLFSCGPLDWSSDVREIPPVPSAARASSILHARGHATFGGRLEHSARGWFGLAQSLVRRGQAGDFRTPARVRGYADTIAAGLGHPDLTEQHRSSSQRRSTSPSMTAMPRTERGS